MNGLLLLLTLLLVLVTPFKLSFELSARQRGEMDRQQG